MATRINHDSTLANQALRRPERRRPPALAWRHEL